MTLEELEQKKRELGGPELTRLQNECLARPGGHELKSLKTNTNRHPNYCGHCFYRPGADKAIS
jgi:hypothetical protein